MSEEKVDLEAGYSDEEKELLKKSEQVMEAAIGKGMLSRLNEVLSDVHEAMSLATGVAAVHDYMKDVGNAAIANPRGALATSLQANMIGAMSALTFTQGYLSGKNSDGQNRTLPVTAESHPFKKSLESFTNPGVGQNTLESVYSMMLNPLNLLAVSTPMHAFMAHKAYQFQQYRQEQGLAQEKAEVRQQRWDALRKKYPDVAQGLGIAFTEVSDLDGFHGKRILLGKQLPDGSWPIFEYGADGKTPSSPKFCISSEKLEACIPKKLISQLTANLKLEVASDKITALGVQRSEDVQRSDHGAKKTTKNKLG